MIKINFIADELAQERNDRIRKRAMLFYAFLWGFAIIITFLKFQDNQSLTDSYKKQTNKLETEIEEVSPQFKQAVQLYLKRNKCKKALKKVYTSNFESGFVLECLINLADKLPANFWLEEIRLVVKQVSVDNSKKNHLAKTLVVKGNLFLDLTAQKQDALQRFQSVIQQNELFSLARCTLNLSDMNVSRFRDKYSHNFEMTFSWLTDIL